MFWAHTTPTGRSHLKRILCCISTTVCNLSHRTHIMITSVARHRVFHYEMHLHILFTCNSFSQLKQSHSEQTCIWIAYRSILLFCFKIMSFPILVRVFPVFPLFSTLTIRLFLSFGHLSSFLSSHQDWGALALKAHCSSMARACISASSSRPHSPLRQVLFILHQSFLLLLTRDLLCKAISWSRNLGQTLPLPLAS